MSDDKKIDETTDKTVENVADTTAANANDDVITKFDIVFDDVDGADDADSGTTGTTGTDDGDDTVASLVDADADVSETSSESDANNAESESDVDDSDADKTDKADKTDGAATTSAVKTLPIESVEVVEAESTAKHIDHEIRHKDAFKFKAYPVLALKHASYAPDRKGGDVLHDVSMEFYSRKTHAVLVDAESEHAAVMGLLSGLMRPTDGKVMFKSQDLLELMPQEYRGHFVGIVSQKYALLPYLSAVENIVMAMEASGRNFLKAKPILAAELLENVGFPDEKNDVRVTDLLEVDRRKAAIARALACEPAVILTDEPTGQLGDDGRDEVLKLLRSLTRKDDHCVVIVTENRDLAKSCDYTYTL